MREYLFHGKRLDNDEWVEGDLFQDRDLGTVHIQGFDYYSTEEGLQRDGYSFEVDPETVGQFTGLADKNGRKIFEGDIIERRLLPTKQICTKSIAKYAERHAAFAINDINGNVIEDYLDSILQMNFEIEVIGNRWDNPELLEGVG